MKKVLVLTLSAVSGVLMVTACGLSSFDGVKGHDGETSESFAVDSASVADEAARNRLLDGIEIYQPRNLPQTVERDMDGTKFKLADQSFTRDRVAEFQKAGTSETKTPKDLQGIWWMDGNMACTCTASFANVDFSVPFPIMSNFSENNFSYQGGNPTGGAKGGGDASYETGVKSFNSAVANNSVYEWHFEGEGEAKYQKGSIFPLMRLNVFGIPLALRIKPTLMRFGFTKKSDDLYLRENYLFKIKLAGAAGQYQLKRILKPSESDPKILVKTKYWDEYVAGQPTKLRMPVLAP
jgi:hypothetical protein